MVKRRVKRVLVVVLAAATLGIISEGGLRWYGVGNPVVRLKHPTIEYLPRPSSEYRLRFNRISYNRWSQRGPDFPLEKKATTAMTFT